ncbi:MAG TPA: cytochrome c peroxidase [Phycisphaerae bacterium]|nr:cytochrome c peroxidase [Phycisphaerae bacterium]
MVRNSWVVCPIVLLCVLMLMAVAFGQQQSPPGAAAPEQPKGLPPLAVPKENPLTPAKVELGKMLYFDRRLSSDGTIACATCHDPQKAWAEHEPTSTGIHKQIGSRNAPTIINAAHMPLMFWDGRMKTLEEQALGPIENPIEMGMKMELVVENLRKVPEYQKRFKEVFGTDVTKEGVAQAIAAFERTILSGDTPYDCYDAGDKNALTEVQKRGMEIFMNTGQCATCHSPPVFSNGRFYNAGVDAEKKEPDTGRKKVTNNDKDMGSFRVPHLRNVADTGPYFHDGSASKLEEAVRLMARGGKDNPNLSPTLKSVREANLSDENIKELVEFLKTLSGKYPIVEPPKLP